MRSRIIEARSPSGDYYSYSDSTITQGAPSESSKVITGARAVVKIGGQTIPFANVSYTYQINNINTAEFKGQSYMRTAKVVDNTKQVYAMYVVFKKLFGMDANIYFSGSAKTVFNGWSLQSYRISVGKCSTEKFERLRVEGEKDELED